MKVKIAIAALAISFVLPCLATTSLEEYQHNAVPFDVSKASSGAYPIGQMVRVDAYIATHGRGGLSLCSHPVRQDLQLALPKNMKKACPHEVINVSFGPNLPSALKHNYIPASFYGIFVGQATDDSPWVNADYFKTTGAWTQWPKPMKQVEPYEPAAPSRHQRKKIPHIAVIVHGVGAALRSDAARLLELTRDGKTDKIRQLVDYNPLVCTLLQPMSNPDWAWGQKCHGLSVLDAPKRAYIIPINPPSRPTHWALQQHGEPTLYSVGVPRHFDKGTRNVRLWVQAKNIRRVDGKPLPAP